MMLFAVSQVELMRGCLRVIPGHIEQLSIVNTVKTTAYGQFGGIETATRKDSVTEILCHSATLGMVRL